jgi:hypothetical protein
MQFFSVPLDVRGWHVDLAGVSLSRGSESGAYHVGLFLQPVGAPDELVMHVFVSLSDAAFLRDAIDEALQAHQARESGAN